jgi:hypothetical protein
MARFYDYSPIEVSFPAKLVLEGNDETVQVTVREKMRNGICGETATVSIPTDELHRLHRKLGAFLARRGKGE